MNKPKNLHRNLRSLMREGSADFDPVPARQPAPGVAWPDGGNQCGQANIKIFAAEALAPYHKGGEV